MKEGYKLIDHLKSDDLRCVKRNMKESTICVWYMNIGCESLWKNDFNNVLPIISNTNNARVVNRTEQLCLLLANSNDIVIQRERPSEIVFGYIKSIGFTSTNIWTINPDKNDDHKLISELILHDNGLIERLRKLKDENLHNEVVLMPYAVTWMDEEIARETGCKLYFSDSKIASWVNSKVNCRELASSIGVQVPFGYICNSVDEVIDAINKMFYKLDIKKIVIKEEYGSSGKGLYIIDSENSLKMCIHLLSKRRTRFQKVKVIVEKWYETLMDINYQIFITPEEKVYYISPKRQITKNGIYNGSVFLVENELKSFQEEFLKETALKVGNKLKEIGYRGLASIDCIMDKDETIFPVIEINGRFSLSTYVSFLKEKYINNRVVKFMYYNIISNNDIDLSLKEIEKYKYSYEKGEGIVIYSLAFPSGKSYTGRLFILFISKDCCELNKLENIIGKILA